MRTVVVGGGVAGMNTATRLLDNNIEVVLVDDAGVGHYSACGIPFTLSNRITLDDIILHTPEQIRDMGVELYHTWATRIHPEDNKVELDSDRVLSYDNLVLATGRVPSVPPIPGRGLKDVYTMTSLSDAQQVHRALESVERAVVVGAGAIGLESAVTMSHRDIDTTLVEALPNVLPAILDPDMARPVQEHVRSAGVALHLSATVDSINGTGRVESITMAGQEIPADMVLLATGVQPNTTLAEDSGLDIGPTGGIATTPGLNALRDGRPLENVYALGDCAEYREAITNAPTLSPLASTAALSAQVIVENIMGEEGRMPRLAHPVVSVVGDLQVAGVGLTTHRAREHGFEPRVGRSKGLTRSRYWPDTRDIHVKVLASGERLIGAQVVSSEDVKERANHLSLAITQGVPVEELRHSERAFTPPLSLLKDPLIAALEDL